MKKNQRKSWAMAYCGIVAALCVALMLLGAVIPIAMFIAPAVAGFLIATVCVECGLQMALTAYAAVSLLALLFVALSALSLPVSLVFLLLNFKKFDSKGLFVTNLLASLMMAASAVCFHSFNTLMAQTTLADAVSGGVSWGVFVSSALFLLSAIVNLIVALRPVTLPPEEKKDDEADNTGDNTENTEASPAEEVTA